MRPSLVQAHFFHLEAWICGIQSVLALVNLGFWTFLHLSCHLDHPNLQGATPVAGGPVPRGYLIALLLTTLADLSSFRALSQASQILQGLKVVPDYLLGSWLIGLGGWQTFYSPLAPTGHHTL